MYTVNTISSRDIFGGDKCHKWENILGGENLNYIFDMLLK